MIDRASLREKVPFGYGRIIAKRAGVTPKSVSDYLNGRMNSVKIELAVLETLAELNTIKNDYLEKIG
jgi:transcriptional regulator with XRE-family HTH domain